MHLRVVLRSVLIVSLFRLISSLPVVNQQLLVLLIGTFHAISSTAERAATGMTAEALGVSVAPSFFQSCVSDGCPVAKMEDVQRYKVSDLVIWLRLVANCGHFCRLLRPL